ncbi:MAG TPA: hypothetical protein VNG53_10605 [Bacteroidia bacterium]|nr:hypothetical protein [Bacteroidia bacterium]
MKRILFLFFLLISGNLLKAQNTAEVDSLQQFQDSLKVLQFQFFQGHDDAKKLAANENFNRILGEALKVNHSFDFEFDSLTTISRLKSSDKQFRLLNWNVPMNDGTQKYFGYIQSYNKRAKKYVIYPLEDKTSEIRDVHIASCAPDKWFGMLYYKIVPEKYKHKTYYTLLAWQGYSNIITKKIIDVVTFNKKGKPTFGSAIFKIENRYPKRMIFIYSANATMSLKYDEKSGMILFDYLAPYQEGMEGQYQFYAPSFRVDGIKFKKGIWYYVKEIDAKNPKTRNDKLFVDPKRGGGG